MKNLIIIIIAVIAVSGIAGYVASVNYSNNAAPAYAPAPAANPAANVPSPTAGQQIMPAPSVSNAPAPVAASTSSPTLVPPANIVSIKNNSFYPSTENITVGTKITWVNNDTVAHTVTSDSGNLLNSGNIAPGQSFSFTFTKPGPVIYHCSIHPTMKGAIVVH